MHLLVQFVSAIYLKACNRLILFIFSDSRTFYFYSEINMFLIVPYVSLKLIKISTLTQFRLVEVNRFGKLKLNFKFSG